MDLLEAQLLLMTLGHKTANIPYLGRRGELWHIYMISETLQCILFSFPKDYI